MYTPGLSFIQLFDRFKVFRAGYNFDPMGCTCMCNEKIAISQNLCFLSNLYSVIVTNREWIVRFIETNCNALWSLSAVNISFRARTRIFELIQKKSPLSPYGAFRILLIETTAPIRSMTSWFLGLNFRLIFSWFNMFDTDTIDFIFMLNF